MTSIGYIMLFGWVPLSIAAFLLLPPRRAVMFGVLAGWLLLPVAGIALPGLPDFTKSTAVGVGPLIGALLFDFGRMISVRPRWHDLPLLVWCVAPVPTSVLNDLGLYDGLATGFSNFLNWGVFYWLGRVYLCDLKALREFCLALMIAGLFYAPLCIFENRMSPKLHDILYGYHQSGGFRYVESHGILGWQPRVFFWNGLALTMFMGATALAAFAVWRSRAARQLMGLPTGLIALTLVAVTILCKSWGPTALMLAGLGLITCFRWPWCRYLIIALLVVAPGYIFLRTTNLWSGAVVLDVIEIASVNRAGSLRTRLENETLLVDKALQKPIFGWGGYGRNRVQDRSGRDISLTDGYWVITLGVHVFVGLTAFTLMLWLPLLLFYYRYPYSVWASREAAPAAALAIVTGLHMIDCLLNAFPNPVFILAIGGLLGLPSVRALVARRKLLRRTARASTAARRPPAPRPAPQRPAASPSIS